MFVYLHDLLVTEIHHLLMYQISFIILDHQYVRINNVLLYALNMLATIKKKIVRMVKVHRFNDNTLLSKKYIRQQECLF